MSQTINVKIPRLKVIQALKDALEKLEIKWKEQPEKVKAYDKKLSSFYEKLMKSCTKENRIWHVSNNTWEKHIEICFRHRFEKDKIEIPKKDFEEISSGNYDQVKKELTNAIILLELCEQEFISTSTYSQIARLL